MIFLFTIGGILVSMAVLPMLYVLYTVLKSFAQRLILYTPSYSYPKVQRKSRKTRVKARPTLVGEAKCASPSSSTKRRSSQRPTAKRKSEPLWKERGWEKQGRLLTGYYRTRYGSYEGKILLTNPPKFFIYDIPKDIKKHEHSACFPFLGTEDGKRRHFVHFKKKPSLEEFSEGIRGVEKILREVLSDIRE
ncbi:MAG: hypothetical protein ABEK17_01225 [Candidatus Aenigmatarchaeota archaeon]